MVSPSFPFPPPTPPSTGAWEGAASQPQRSAVRRGRGGPATVWAAGCPLGLGPPATCPHPVAATTAVLSECRASSTVGRPGSYGQAPPPPAPRPGHGSSNGRSRGLLATPQRAVKEPRWQARPISEGGRGGGGGGGRGWAGQGVGEGGGQGLDMGPRPWIDGRGKSVVWCCQSFTSSAPMGAPLAMPNTSDTLPRSRPRPSWPNHKRPFL